MSGQTGGFDDNPYIFTKTAEIPVSDPKMVAFQNPASAFFAGMADFVKVLTYRGTEAPEGQSVYVMGQSQGELIESTTGPNPAIAIGSGEAQATAMSPSVTGDESYNTFVQLIMDRSEGMNSVAGEFQGQTLLKCDLARALAAIMVSQCAASRSHFALYSFNETGHADWPGPSNDYEGALEYLLGSNSQAFIPSGLAEHSAGCQIACDGMKGGIPTASGERVEIDRAVTIVFSDTCYDWWRQHWGTLEWESNKPLDQFMREKGPVFYVGMGSTGLEDQIIPYFGGVMRNTGGGDDYGASNYRGGMMNQWVYFPGTMRLQAEVCYNKAAGIPFQYAANGRPSSVVKSGLIEWPHNGIDMGEYFKAVMLAPDRGDGMITLAGTFAALVRMTHPDGDYQ
jgi:hypothetical protein